MDRAPAPSGHRELRDLDGLRVDHRATHALRGVEADVRLVGERVADHAGADAVHDQVAVLEVAEGDGEGVRADRGHVFGLHRFPAEDRGRHFGRHHGREDVAAARVLERGDLEQRGLVHDPLRALAVPLLQLAGQREEQVLRVRRGETAGDAGRHVLDRAEGARAVVGGERRAGQEAGRLIRAVAVAGRAAVSPTQPDAVPRRLTSLWKSLVLICCTAAIERIGLMLTSRSWIIASITFGTAKPPSAPPLVLIASAFCSSARSNSLPFRRYPPNACLCSSATSSASVLPLPKPGREALASMSSTFFCRSLARSPNFITSAKDFSSAASLSLWAAPFWSLAALKASKALFDCSMADWMAERSDILGSLKRKARRRRAVDYGINAAQAAMSSVRCRSKASMALRSAESLAAAFRRVSAFRRATMAVASVREQPQAFRR